MPGVFSRDNGSRPRPLWVKLIMVPIAGVIWYATRVSTDHHADKTNILEIALIMTPILIVLVIVQHLWQRRRS